MPKPSRLKEHLNKPSTSLFLERLQKWFVVSAIIGALAGLVVAGVDAIIYDVFWTGARRLSLSWYWALALPTMGVLVSSFLVNRYVSDPELYGTEEVIESFHEEGGRIDEKSALAKAAAAIATVGLGGSLGLEGPAIHIGAVTGSALNQRLRRFGFHERDRRWMMLAGAAAGIAAIFRAPLTGIVFALEVPYKDDLAHQAFIPALTASVTSYVVFVSIMGSKPLFVVSHSYTLDYRLLFLASVLGVLCGFGARLFVLAFEQIGRLYRAAFPGAGVRALAGGIVLGLTGVASLAMFRAPLSLDTGYEAIRLMLDGKIALYALLVLILLKVIATSSTVGGGGIGGLFVPLVFLGTALGSAFGKLMGSKGIIFAVVGMSGFLAAGYNVPLAATTFVAETTGSPVYIIPGLLAAAIAYVASGSVSLSSRQRFGDQTIVQRVLSAKVAEVMSHPAITVPAEVSIDDFMNKYVARYRHLHFPVEEQGRLVGMASAEDAGKRPKELWLRESVSSITRRDVRPALETTRVPEAIMLMEEQELERLPVMSVKGRVVGVVSLSDITRAEKLSELTR